NKAGRFYSVFETLESLQNLKIADTRRDNLARKRQGKWIQSFVGLPPLTSSVTPVRTGPPGGTCPSSNGSRSTSRRQHIGSLRIKRWSPFVPRLSGNRESEFGQSILSCISRGAFWKASTIGLGYRSGEKLC